MIYKLMNGDYINTDNLGVVTIKEYFVTYVFKWGIQSINISYTDFYTGGGTEQLNMFKDKIKEEAKYLKELIVGENEFEDLYQNYVIYEVETDSFIGKDSNFYRTSIFAYAAIFTKKEALEYLKNGAFIEKDKTYRIRNAN